MNRGVCRHCNRNRVGRPRGLCTACYYRPGVRDLYPSTHPFARFGSGQGTGNRPLPPEPTRHPPGSPGKLAVLEERAAAGVGLHHPRDAGHGEG